MNIAKLMQEAQKAHADMQKTMGELEVEGSSGGGLVKVRLNGLKDLRGVHIDSQALAGEEVGLVADLVMAAWEDAVAKLEVKQREVLGKMGMPSSLVGLF
ncbi:MAG: YbaB/EbfC family nucleoid-associated protein [Thermoanaerobaculaceae bacterium]|nr:YbaB/EbfC family nucleoid-associated protein [Thermoanaerobaculaceae bacterium]MDI9620475.1 YbaB/EbfC family nucleoid-associated protein [Acidobacteriota bacterium]NLH12731.1 YbaB/EbfC family nucleoid-associated protein [Holophagae bacterium]HPW55709.1 YbaB/EbfC family nucleoid-associated protein [Thermoanaerobaculaceae bacterium]